MKSFKMKVKENVKKIALLGGSTALLVGANAAFAYNLNEGLAPFAQDAQNLVVVVGSKAKPIDTTAAMTLIDALKQSVPQETKLETETEVSENAVKLWKDNDKINIGEGFKLTSFDKQDFPELLADGTLESDTGTNYDYRQYIDLTNDAAIFTYDQPQGDMDPELIEDLSKTSRNDPLITYTVEFEDPVPFVVKDANGNLVANPNLIGNKIVLLGKTYVVSSETTPDKLVLYEAARRVTVTKDKPVTLELENKTYKISIVGFSTKDGTNQVVLDVNGDVDSVTEGNTKTIGGLTIYADTIWTEDNNKAGGAVLLVGGKKLVLKDGDEVKIGEDEDSVDNTYVEINGGLTATKSIQIKMWDDNADTDYIEQGKSWDDKVFNQLSIFFEKVNTPLEDNKTRDMIYLTPSGTDELKLTLPYEGNTITEKFVKMDKATGTFELQNDDDKPIYVAEGQAAEEDSYIFAPQIREVSGHYIPDGDYTVLLKVDNIQVDNTSTDDDYVELKDVLTGDTYKTADFTWDPTGKNGSQTTTIYIKGRKYTIKPIDVNGDGVADKIELYDNEDAGVVVYPLVKLDKGEEVGFYAPVELNNSVAGVNIEDNMTPVTKTLVLPTGEIKITYFDANPKANNVTEAINVTDPFTGKTCTLNATNTKCQVQVNTLTYNVTELNLNLVDNTTVTNDSEIEGVKITLANYANPSFLLKEERLEGQSDLQRNVLVFEAEKESGGTDIAIKAPDNTYTGYKSYNSNTDLEGAVTEYGTFIKVYKPDDNDGWIKVYYPDDELAAYVYLQGKEIKYKPGETEVAPVAKLDVELVKDNDPKVAQATKLISIGGPCVNMVTQEFLAGTPYGSCQTWPLQPGQALIKYVEKGGKAALIIAGTKGEDTLSAVKKFINDYKTMNGTEAILTFTETPNAQVNNQ